MILGGEPIGKLGQFGGAAFAGLTAERKGGQRRRRRTRMGAMG